MLKRIARGLAAILHIKPRPDVVRHSLAETATPPTPRERAVSRQLRRERPRAP